MKDHEHEHEVLQRGFPGNLSSMSMLRGRVLLEDKPPGAGNPPEGGLALLDDLKPMDVERMTIVNDEDATKVILEGRREYNRLLETFKKDRTQAEARWGERARALEEALRAAVAKNTDIEQRLNDAQRTAPDWRLEDGSLKHAAKRLVAPKGVSQELFCATVLKPDEMRYVSALHEEDLAQFNPYFRAARKGLDVSDKTSMRIEEFQALSDTIVFADIVKAGRHEDNAYARSGSYKERIKSLPWYDSYRKLALEVGRALSGSTSSNVGEDWVPYFMSANLKLLVQAQTLVANLFDEVQMPTPKYDYPVEGQDANVYLIGEATSDTESTNVITADTPKTAKITLQAIKLALRILMSSEILEDSIINLASDVLRRIAKSFARGWDETILSGDTAGSHMDTDVTNAKDRRKSWNGLRKQALISGMPNVDLATFNTPNLLGIRKGMGVYGSRPSALAWIVGFKGMIEMIKLAEVITMEKYGPNATVISGEIAKFFGSPVVLSEFIREDVNANAVYDGVTTTKSYVLCVNRECYVRGERRAITLNSSDDRHIETDQTVIVGTTRVDFKSWFSTAAAANKIVGIGRNLA